MHALSASYSPLDGACPLSISDIPRAAYRVVIRIPLGFDSEFQLYVPR